MLALTSFPAQLSFVLQLNERAVAHFFRATATLVFYLHNWLGFAKVTRTHLYMGSRDVLVAVDLYLGIRDVAKLLLHAHYATHVRIC